MKISSKDWQNYIATLRKINETAAEKVAEYMRSHDCSTPEGMKALIDYAHAVSTKYGEGAAELSCEMLDEVAEASGAFVPAAEPAATATYGEIAKTIYGTMAATKDPDAVGAAVGRSVKLASVDTLQQNALRDGAEWAWIPAGDTCPFCLMLASRGWVKASKKAIKNGHADHIHNNCDCTYCVRFDHETTVEGYDPDALYEEYINAGDTPKERLNALRRKHYAENKDYINAQKRAAYAKRVERKILADNENLSEAGRLARKAKEAQIKENLRLMLSRSVTIGQPYVNPEMIHSNEFSKKFSRITDNSKVNDTIRSLAQGNLTKNNGSYTEMLDIIDLDTGASIIHKLGEKDTLSVGLTAEEKAIVKNYKGRMICLHNHPTNIMPTGSDFVVAAARGYEYGIVVTHDLRVFIYTPPKKIVTARAIDDIIDKNTKMLYNDNEKRKGMKKAMEELERRFGITWKEL